ncbi:MAG: hypothetical protein CBC83_05565 [Flavobacteriales bacterium TMED123]|nr:MAG: hypothetical protein CBC83_05565 [Flavobacteriales bacterium TMED123]
MLSRVSGYLNKAKSSWRDEKGPLAKPSVVIKDVFALEDLRSLQVMFILRDSIFRRYFRATFEIQAINPDNMRRYQWVLPVMIV